MALLLAGLAACSAVKLAYGSLDDVAYWWLDSYIDFTDEQKPRVRDDLRRLHAWHRAEELPKIAELLRRIEVAAPASIGAEQACSFVPLFRDRLGAVAARAELEGSTLARNLLPRQIAHLERKYASNDAPFRREWLEPATWQLQDKRLKQFVDRAETVYGTLTEAQRTLVEDHLSRSSFDAKRTLAERHRRQQDALATLRRVGGQRLSAGDTQRLLRGYFERALVSPDPSYRAYQDALIRENCTLVAALHESTTPAQRESAVRRLRGWQRDLAELAGQR